MKHYFPTGRRNHGRPLNRLLDSETGTGQQVAQLNGRYMMMMMRRRRRKRMSKKRVRGLEGEKLNKLYSSLLQP